MSFQQIYEILVHNFCANYITKIRHTAIIDNNENESKEQIQFSKAIENSHFQITYS